MANTNKMHIINWVSSLSHDEAQANLAVCLDKLDKSDVIAFEHGADGTRCIWKPSGLTLIEECLNPIIDEAQHG